MTGSLLTHICVTEPHWVKHWHIFASSIPLQIMLWHGRFPPPPPPPHTHTHTPPPPPPPPPPQLPPFRRRYAIYCCLLTIDEIMTPCQVFCIIGSLRGESTGNRWIHQRRTSNVSLWFFLCSWLVEAIEQRTEWMLIRDTMKRMWRHIKLKPIVAPN